MEAQHTCRYVQWHGDTTLNLHEVKCYLFEKPERGNRGPCVFVELQSTVQCLGYTHRSFRLHAFLKDQTLSALDLSETHWRPSVRVASSCVADHHRLPYCVGEHIVSISCLLCVLSWWETRPQTQLPYSKPSCRSGSEVNSMHCCS